MERGWPWPSCCWPVKVVLCSLVAGTALHKLATVARTVPQSNVKKVPSMRFRVATVSLPSAVLFLAAQAEVGSFNPGNEAGKGRLQAEAGALSVGRKTYSCTPLCVRRPCHETLRFAIVKQYLPSPPSPQSLNFIVHFIRKVDFNQSSASSSFCKTVK